MKLSRDPKRCKIITALETDLEQYVTHFKRVTELQTERNRLVFEKLRVIGPEIEASLTQIMERSYGDANIKAVYEASRMLRTAMLARFHTARFLIQNDEASYVRAIGDANGRGAFTHTSYNDYEILAAKMFDDDPRKVSDRVTKSACSSTRRSAASA